MKHLLPLFTLLLASRLLADGATASVASLIINDQRAETAPAVVAPAEAGEAGIVIDFIISGTGLTGIKDSSLTLTECTIGKEKALIDLAKKSRLSPGGTQLAEDGGAARFAIRIPTPDALRDARSLKLKGSLIAYGKGETETSAAMALPETGAAASLIGRFRISAVPAPGAAQIRLRVEGGMDKFISLALTNGDTELKEIRRTRADNAILLDFPAPPAGKTELKVLTWKSREQITVPFAYGMPADAPAQTAAATPPAAEPAV